MKNVSTVAPLVPDDVISGTSPTKLLQVNFAILPKRDGNILISTLIDAYMLSYNGKDQSRGQRMRWWQSRIGHLLLNEVEDDHIYFTVKELSEQKGRYFAGLDADGNKIFKAKNKSLSPATLNRYVASIGALFTWTIKRRIAPKGWIHPCRGIERLPENNERVRFLSTDELSRLLRAVKESPWDRLYLIVLLGITTGARKDELLRLKWNDIDIDNGIAYTGITKNGDRKTIPLLPNVINELMKFKDTQHKFIFASKQIPTQPYSFDFRFSQALKKAKVKDFHFHDLRHSCASYLVQSHATLVEVADILGHKDLRTTRRYAHLGTEHKAQVVNRILGHIQ